MNELRNSTTMPCNNRLTMYMLIFIPSLTMFEGDQAMKFSPVTGKTVYLQCRFTTASPAQPSKYLTASI
jgi:hypothetical protein